MFSTVLVANRGEIAVRVIRTLRRLGVRTVAVYSDADAGARHVALADEAVRIGPAAAAGSYLNAAAIVEAARATGAQAVHPGYGFLAENAAFARAVTGAGLVFVGPPPEAIEAMGDKIRAKRHVAAAGVPVVPGRDEAGLSDAELAAAAREVGLPVLLKPSAGGGGKGMRLVHAADELDEAIAAARREARSAFGDDTLLVERFVSRPRHIEVQVFADAHGNAVHLGERECSLQRRHQKIIEEAPSPLLSAGQRERMGASAVDAARSVGYVGAGTVEYIVPADDPDAYFFMEMNTRLQVEHPVTEMAAAVGDGPGPDLVELQLRVAAGEPLPFGQDAVGFAGHAIEARVYAEDPARGFVPTGGRVLALDEPGTDGGTSPPSAAARVRVDSGLSPGADVGSAYDPMLAKVVGWAWDRTSALAALDRALASYGLLGVGTNVAFLRALLAHPDVAAGRLDTGLVERDLDALVAAADAGAPDAVLAAAVLDARLEREPAGPAADRWDVPDGWRAGGPAWHTLRVTPAGGDAVPVRIRGRASAAEVTVGGGEPVPASARRDGDRLVVTYAGRTVRYLRARDDGGTSRTKSGRVLWLGRDGHAWALAEAEPIDAARTRTGAAAGGTARSPMPGTVIAVKAAVGDEVAAGRPLAVIEAMKMEHTVTAPIDGVVTDVPVRPGATVALDAAVAVVEPLPQGERT